MVGTGVMGSPWPGRCSCRPRVTVWNRTAARADRWRRRRTIAGSLPEAIAASDVTFMCVSNQAAADEL